VLKNSASLSFLNRGGKVLLLLLLFNFSFAQNPSINSLILSQNYEFKSDNAFLSVLLSYSKLVDYEAYETKSGAKVLYYAEIALKINEEEKDEDLRLYRKAVLDGIVGTILLKRNSYIKGIAKMNDSQKSWEKLVGAKDMDDAAALFSLGLAEYYRITVFNKAPKNEKFNAALEKMRNAVSKEDDAALYMSLSYVWVLQEQKLWEEARKLFEIFFDKYPNNTMMLRAAQTIAVDKRGVGEIKRLASRLDEISNARNPKNYSDVLSARRAEIFALNLEKKSREACEIAKETLDFYANIPEEDKKISWVKKHYEAISKESRKCR
jgi:tetratricopeptide (TPR) repeat protein